jgi:2-dehydropantoate 2-reductase
MRYVIYGAGAIGGSIGARLFQHEHEVVLVCRRAHLEAVQRDGLTFRTPAETVTLPVTAVAHPSEVQFRGDEVVLLTMKSQDTAAALDELRAAAGDVPVVCAQNGVANERMALRRFSKVYGMLVVLPATHLEPGVVLMHATDVGGVLDAGCYPNGVDPLIEQVTADITASGFSARPDPNVMRLKYSKLLGNLLNAVQALCERGDGAGDLARLVREEAVACYEAAGIDYAPPEELMGRRSANVTPGQIEGAPRSGGSTWQSLARGAGALETDYLNGEIALLGALHGLPTPYNRAVQQAAAEAAREGAQPGSYSAEQIIARARELAGAAPA